MNTLRIACVVMFALIFVSGGKPADKKAVENRCETSSTDRAASQPHSASVDVPFEVYPFKETFVTAEGDPFLVELSVDCPPDASNDSEFKLLDHPPHFVSLSAP